MSTLPDQYVHRTMPSLWGDVYIETGLSEGNSMQVALSWDSPPFKELYGIEIDSEMVMSSRKRFSGESRLKIYEGSSIDVLPKIMDGTKKTVFWLDAHYDGAKQTSFDPRHGQCVLLDELRFIVGVQWARWPIVIIDDASTFCSDLWWIRGAHGHGMDRKQNPSFHDIYDVLGVVDNKYKILISDQRIFCIPNG